MLKRERFQSFIRLSKRRSYMKKTSIISLLVGILVLVFAAEPCLSQALKEEFAGYRYRLSGAVPGTVRDFACRRNIDGQTAQWQVVVGNPLVDGYWYNWDTKCRYEIVAYTVTGSPNIPCDPSEDPPIDPYGIVTGGYFVFGPFTLTPTAALGGTWEGMWKLQADKDNNRVVTAEAKGHGGLLEGRTLHLSSEIPAPMPSYCACPGCPTSGKTNMCFDGWVLTPANVK
jgi:hypothetical protein